MDKKIIISITAVSLIILVGGVYLLSLNSGQSLNSPRYSQVLSQSGVQSGQTDALPKPPDFTLPKYDGSGDVNLVASYSQKPTVVQFWATWCEFCRREFPITNAVVATYQGKINFIAVNFSKESRSQVRDYIKQLQLDPKVLTFVMDDSGAVGRAYGVTGTPVHLFIKRGGEVSLLQIGYMTPQKVKEEIAKIL